MNGDLRITTGSGRGTAGIARIEGGANIPFRANRGRGLLIFSRDSVLDNFSEVEYVQKNPDVAAAVKAGSFSSGLEHYTKFGQFEPNRSATFVGTDGNDIVTGFGNGKTEITGVDLDRSYAFGGEGNYFSNGSNEFDTLIGSQGADTFILAYDFTSPPPSQMVPDAQELYRGSGEARIRGFNPSQGDVLRLAGQATDYQISPIGADLVISKPGDTIAIIEGGANLNLRQLTFPPVSPVFPNAKSAFLLG
jgi:Ca2+-binding RTX toxin-like protein